LTIDSEICFEKYDLGEVWFEDENVFWTSIFKTYFNLFIYLFMKNMKHNL